MDLLKSIFKGDKIIWIIFLFLCLISITEVFSASSTLVYKSGNHWGPITQHCTFLAVGALVVVFIHNIPYKWFQVFPLFLLPISGLFLLMLLVFNDLNIGGLLVIERVNEAGRWIKLAGIQFQPSEFAKMAVVIVTAFILSKGQTEDGADPKAFKRIMIIAGTMCAFILPENYSTGVLLFGTVYLVMFVGRVQMRKLLVLGGSMIAVAIVFITFLTVTPNDVLSKIPVLGSRATTWKTRINDFTNNEVVPAAKYDTDGDAQVAHARIAIATSNMVGKGPGNSIQRDFLSQAFSDFIFAIIVEELGLIGGAFVVFLYICLLIRAGRIAKKCDRTFPAFLVLGIALLLVTQALFNMMVAVGLAPVTGQPLPLISRGGTSTIINCVYIGMILSVSRYVAHLETIKEQEQQALLAVAQDGENAPSPMIETTDNGAAEPTAHILNNDTEFQ